MTALPEIDLGAQGPAARARPGAMVRSEGEWRGTIRDGVSEAYRHSDATTYDLMHARGQLSDRQHAAAERLAGLYGPLQRTVGRYIETTTGGDDEPDSRTEYRHALRGLPVPQALPVEALIIAGQHPGMRLDDCHAGLDALAREWGIG